MIIDEMLELIERQKRCNEVFPCQRMDCDDCENDYSEEEIAELLAQLPELLKELKELKELSTLNHNEVKTRCEFESENGECLINECMYWPIEDKDKYNLCEAVRKSLDDNKLRRKQND